MSPALRRVILMIAAIGLVTGCSQRYNDERGKGDAPVQGRSGDNTPAEVFNMPDGFGNLATKCVGHGFRAYVTTNAGGPSNLEIVPDRSCTG
ncbi:hypothetical protein [Streptomyces sp. CC219B]|uniref:hypothetical protein n=1 Tax=Streptomyces sp. CC219B TaxID=3044574 RepID=UPI0024A9A14A|nr:hypothetical protein [Streptomyces sp. CC219B]